MRKARTRDISREGGSNIGTPLVKGHYHVWLKKIILRKQYMFENLVVCYFPQLTSKLLFW